MTAVWLCAYPGTKEAFGTEREAESRAAYLLASKTTAFVVTYRVEVEPATRDEAYWAARLAETGQGRPRGSDVGPSAADVVRGPQIEETEGVA